jgi:hypothetical protein
MEEDILFCFLTLSMGEKRYKLFGKVTNREIDGQELVFWHRQRCGKTKELHGLMKNFVLQREWKNKRMKAIRFNIIHFPAKIINHSREVIIRKLLNLHTTNHTATF